MRLSRSDVFAVVTLVALWLLFFWRLFTPVAADQVSLKQGDFSGQFVAFAAYQYDRISSGELPLWNPYNNSGLPFVADTQAAVFYPPRLLTIALSSLAGGWGYHALELEMTAHILLYTLLMYAFVRRLTQGQRGSVYGAFVAAVIAGYGGFMSGYPPLQLAILEAGIWLPLALLGIHEATVAKKLSGWRCLMLAGVALGLSWLAGHPQTSYFLTLLMLAYLGYRVYEQRRAVGVFVLGAFVLGGVAFGIAAIQLIPGLEYLPLTSRPGLGYDAKGNGFPVHDIVQFVFPGIVSVFSPLYVGVVGLVLALIAMTRRVMGAWFWGGAAVLALLLSFGANGVLYPLLYNILPGLSYFRGQERAAYLVANGLAILAGLGMVELLSRDRLRDFPSTLRLRVWLNRLFIVCLGLSALLLVVWLGNPTAYGAVIQPVIFSTAVVALILLVLPWLLTSEDRLRPTLMLVGLLVLELFSVNMTADAVYDRVPPDQQLSLAPPSLVAPVLDDPETPFRVDGFRGLGDNYGSLYGVMDMRGISPLFLDSAFGLIEPEKINPPAWEVFAVRYVYTDWAELPIASDIVAEGEDRFGTVNLHRLDNPRPFALLSTNYTVVDSEAAGRAMLSTPEFNPRQTLVIEREPTIEMSDSLPETAVVSVTEFAPERVVLAVDVSENALLSIALVHYPGWGATLNGEPVDILRAYGVTTAVEIPAGEHNVEFRYQPVSFRVGVALSLVTWLVVAVATIARRRSRE